MTEKVAIGLPDFMKRRILNWASKEMSNPQFSEVLNKRVAEAVEAAVDAAAKKVGPSAQQFGESMGEAAVRGAAKQIDPILREKVAPFLKDIQKEIPNTVSKAVDKGLEQLSDTAASTARKFTAAAGIGGLAGAAAAPSDERLRGALRGSVGGLLGATGGAAWGRLLPSHQLLPALGGAMLGGAAGGAVSRLGKTEGTFGDRGMESPREIDKESSMQGCKYAGVTLDWYDDNGATLKQKFPTLEQVPAIIKEAAIRPKDKVPNEDFALILIDGGHVFRKFACADPGTTAMSVIYFMEHGDKLPEEAQKTAATNLVNACLAHNLMPPAQLTKMADWRTPAMIAGGGLLAGGATLAGLLASMGERGRRQLSNELHDPRLYSNLKSLATLKSREERVKAHEGLPGRQESVLDAMSAGFKGGKGKDLRMLSSDEEAQKISSVVDVTGKRPAPRIKMAGTGNPEDYAVIMPDGSRHYPIHSWDLVKKAEDYFLENRIRFQPEIRRQFATKLASKASTLGYPIAQEISTLGSKTYARSDELRDAIDMRKVACAPGSPREFLDDLLEKHANIHPEVYAECLKRFDIAEGLDKGWDHVIPDPWSSTFGTKTAAYDVIWEEGADRVTRDALEDLAENHLPLVSCQFTYDVAKEFKKDPVGIFESMPLTHKKILARMASDAEADGTSEKGTNEKRASIPSEKLSRGPVELSTR